MRKRSWRLRLLGVLLAGGWGCDGLGPPGSFFNVGESYVLWAVVVTTYDCDPGLTDLRDDAWCGDATGGETQSADTLNATIALEGYQPLLSCDDDGCRETRDGTFSTVVAGTRRDCSRSQAVGPIVCAAPAEIDGAGSLSVRHVRCEVADRRRVPSLPRYCEGRDGQEIILSTVALPGGIAFLEIEEGGALTPLFSNADVALGRLRQEVSWSIQ